MEADGVSLPHRMKKIGFCTSICADNSEKAYLRELKKLPDVDPAVYKRLKENGPEVLEQLHLKDSKLQGLPPCVVAVWSRRAR
jgi:hypothetical protein